MRNGIDCATKITKTVAEKLADAGQTFVARYLVPDKYEWKRLSPEEARIISDAGMDILSVFESMANRALSGFQGGQIDAGLCIEEAKRVGQPKETAIYFAVDFDVTSPDQLDLIEQYLKGAATVLGTTYAVGLYAEYEVIEEMKKRGAAKHFWQTYAWSKGKRSVHANVYQFKNGQTLAGITVDFNNSFGNEGFWNLKPVGVFADVPPNHWAAKDIEAVKDAGILVGGTDGNFNPDQPVTRAQLAAVLHRLMKREDK